MNKQVLMAKGLTVARGDVVLCSDINFTLESGQILHVQGQNGIGKTTLLMMLAGLISGDEMESSQLKWGDVLPNDWSVLYLGHLAGINSGLTVRENLRFLQGLNTTSSLDLDAALQHVGLSGYEDIVVGKLSSGQKRRVSLARLWLADEVEQLWLLDEPFTALDTEMAQRLNERLMEFTAKGGRVILTSHQPLGIATDTLNLEKFVVQHDGIDCVSEC